MIDVGASEFFGGKYVDRFFFTINFINIGITRYYGIKRFIFTYFF